MSETNGAFGFNKHLYGLAPTIAQKLLDLDLVLEKDNWVEGTDEYTYTITIQGMLETVTPVVVPQTDDDTTLEEFSKIIDVESTENTLTFTATSQPSIDLSVVCKGAIANRYNAIADLTDTMAEVDTLQTDVGNLQTEVGDATKLPTPTSSVCDNIYELKENLTVIGTTVSNTISSTEIGSGSWGGGANITLPKGVWIVRGWVTFSQNATGYRAVGLGTPTSLVAYSRVLSPAASGNQTMMEYINIVSVDTDTIVCVSALQTSGSSLTVTTEINAVRIA